MKRYELVEAYPGSPKVGTIVALQEMAVCWDGYEKIYVTDDGYFSFPAPLIEDWPRHWKDADRDKRTLLQKTKDFLDSPEGQAALDRFGEEVEKDTLQESRNYERFKRMVDHTGIDELVEKIIAKYDTDEYVKREHKLGYQPREPLTGYILSYFEEFGEVTTEGTNIFMDVNYRLGNYTAGLMIGQGSYIKIQRYGEIEKS